MSARGWQTEVDDRYFYTDTHSPIVECEEPGCRRHETTRCSNPWCLIYLCPDHTCMVKGKVVCPTCKEDAGAAVKGDAA
jgi:hypothetical protein